jgi:hypothetical protein
LQGAAGAAMHVHIAGGNARYIEQPAECFEQLQAAHVEAAGQELDAQP